MTPYSEVPLVVIVSHTHAAAFEKRVCGIGVLRELCRRWHTTDSPFLIYWQAANTARDAGVREDQLRDAIRSAIADIGCGMIRWALDIDDIPRVEAMVREETLRATEPVGHRIDRS